VATSFARLWGERTRTDIPVPSRAKWIAENPMSDQAPSSGTDDKQVIIDINDMHNRYSDLWVEIDLEDINVAHLKHSFSWMCQQLDNLPIPQQIARLSKMVQQLEKILSKNKGRKNSESASIVSESKTGASGVPSAVSKLSVSQSSGNIPGASAAAFPTARPDSNSEVTEPGSSGKRTAVQAALADRPNYQGENCRRVAIKKSVPSGRM
jgi:hypothetical protein